MLAAMTTLGDIIEALDGSGLSLRGGFHPGDGDDAPDGVRTLVLLGNAGRDGLWDAFSAGRRDEPDPLDAWSKRTVDAVAETLGARALYPFTEPYLPFQRWAMKAAPVFPSPTGALVDIRSGLWHGYRGALGFAEDIYLPPREEAPDPCAACAAKPCTSACPVGAVSLAGGYDVPACLAHLESEAGGDCLENGCLARRACPVGRDAAYGDAQMRFHMDAFVRLCRC